MDLSSVGGSVTEEGKRTCPYADRPILEALRLPSSVTAPHDLLFVIGLVLSQNAAIQIVFCSGAAPPSPRGKAFTSSNVLCTAKRFLITINLFARGRFPHHKTLPLHADISTPHRVAGATIVARRQDAGVFLPGRTHGCAPTRKGEV